MNLDIELRKLEIIKQFNPIVYLIAGALLKAELKAEEAAGSVEGEQPPSVENFEEPEEPPEALRVTSDEGDPKADKEAARLAEEIREYAKAVAEYTIFYNRRDVRNPDPQRYDRLRKREMIQFYLPPEDYQQMFNRSAGLRGREEVLAAAQRWEGRIDSGNWQTLPRFTKMFIRAYWEGVIEAYHNYMK